MNSNVICILGAHRSGTSMLTRLLHSSGLALGAEADMMPAAADNPDGFWENLRFVRLNDEVLNTVGAAWDLPPSQEEAFEQEALRPLRLKAQLVIDSFESEPVWGWKDPRNCLTLPFWSGLLPQLKFVIIVRNPLEVAYSMHKRNGTSYALGLRLWEIYTRRSLSATEPKRRIITDYQRFFDDPEEELQRITQFIGLPEREVHRAAALVTKERRHTTFSREQLIDAGVSEAIIRLYADVLRQAAEGDLDLVDSQPQQKKETDSAFAAVDTLAGSANLINLNVPESEDVRRELAQRRGAEIQHQEQLRQHHEQLRQLQARIEALTQELSGEKVRAALEIGHRDGRVVELQAAYAHLDQLLRREQATRERLAEQGLREAAETEKIRQRFLQTNRLLHSHSIQLTEREKEATELSERLRRQLFETRRLIRFLDETARAADLLRKSRRWRMGNPFMWLAVTLGVRKQRGFGHLDKVVGKFNSWQSSHPEMKNLDDAIAALKARREYVAPPLPAGPEPVKQEGGTKPPAPKEEVRFPTHSAVEVSIIIPVFNQVEFTHACLASIQQLAVEIPFEVIVVDDSSSDNSQALLQAIPGLVYCRNETNAGFIASCNRGAARARGRYLLFLNNDTVVSAGWLEVLHETFTIEPKAGLVGSKLLYPDGRLQEAGGIIWRDASGWNRGKFQDAARPEYNFLREVDYCSAASIMVPKDLFTSLGGFDSKYAPAYYEDTDFAFKVADSGHKVLYQPLSVVIHYEGITGGTDISAGTKKYQEVNRATFASTWAKKLATRPNNGDLEAWENLPAGSQRILAIDHHLPLADRDSGSLRMFHILTLLHSLGHRVTFLPDNLADIPPYGDALRRRGIEFLHHPYAKSIGDYLETHGSKFNVVILSRRDFARKHIDDVRRFAPKARLIFDTVDLHFLREAREAELTQNQVLSRKMEENRALEYELIDKADETWVVSSAEKQVLHEERPGARIVVLSNIVPVADDVAPFSLRRDILFIGSFKHTPNIDAVLFFAQEILPRIHRQVPDLRFYIIGEKAPPEVIAHASDKVIVTGYQPDVKMYFQSVRLSVAPLRYGAGVKGKINQSMGFGVPVVATQVAAEGMGLQSRENILMADDPAAFAAAVVELYTSEDLWTRLSRNSREKTTELYSLETAQRQLSQLFGTSQPQPATSLLKNEGLQPEAQSVQGPPPAYRAPNQRPKDTTKTPIH